MDENHPIEKAIRRAYLGDFGGAIGLLRQFLDASPAEGSAVERDRARLLVASCFRNHGDYDESLAMLRELAGNPAVDKTLRAHAWIETAINQKCRGDYPQAFQSLDLAERLMDFHVHPGEAYEKDTLFSQYHLCRGNLCYRTGRMEEALQEYLRARDFYLPTGSRYLVNCYLNIANIHAIVGRKGRARECIALALATQRQFGHEHAYGLVHLFEVLASHNLFVYGSEQKAIDSLMQISEEVVKNFGDFSKVFDFFSSILVQLHGGKIDLDVIRKITHEYGDDPLIKDFLPSLLTGCPPPAESAGGDLEDEVGGGGGELENLEGEGEEEDGEEPGVYGDEDEEDDKDEEDGEDEGGGESGEDEDPAAIR